MTMQLRLVALALVLRTAGVAHANMGKPWSGGSYPGEATGISGIKITHEELVIDMRPLAGSKDLPCSVSATYHLDNPGEATSVDVVFVSGTPNTDFKATLDGRPIATGPYHGTLPRAWEPPKSSIYDLRHASSTELSLDIPSGRHDVVITYKADASIYHRGDPTIHREVTYVLAPAKTWGGFGGLDVTVLLAPGWSAKSTPELQRAGDALKGSFPNIPADTLEISARASEATIYSIVAILTKLLLLGTLIGGGVWVVLSSRRSSGWPTLGRAVLWTAAVITAGVIAVLGADWVLPAGQADVRGYGRGIAIVFIVLLGMIVLGIGIAMSVVASRRIKVPDSDGRLR